MNSHDDPNEYGVAQYCVPALTFIAQDRWIQTGEANGVWGEGGVGLSAKELAVIGGILSQYHNASRASVHPCLCVFVGRIVLMHSI